MSSLIKQQKMMSDPTDAESQPLNAAACYADSINSEEEDLPMLNDNSRPSRGKRDHLLRTPLLIVGVLLCTGILGACVGAFVRGRFADWDAGCAEYTAKHSPVIQDVDVKYDTQLFNGSLMKEDIYRQGAGPEVDAAWEALGVDYRAAIISDEEGRMSGLTSAHVQRAEKYGGGFFVNVEGLHHLHCLNLLRKSLYYNYDHYKAMGMHAFANEDYILRLHVSHCLDTIRQVLMCNVDTGMLGQVWYDQQDAKAFPDFNTEHTCKNYDEIRAWAEERQAPPAEELPLDYMRTPEGVLPEIP
ncbi:hypothetical protein M406DRAFT_355917 [Cryphonectria parasitica EP155]|uniref:Tat pathway signal sequence n=1 Tax=Cryphonectria parasitica (strain ATCC 38755 / EP155) TaxID=660469 RepID=A0A9P4Y2J0_CRYP1|nr:uncharacterized protein M406DRAFT_355917 [Cryphonectria parasitica EP155]KAF3765436.1 hypothetical protein M406DRAFT_355917 [Cryphonectria parasitica EP155]